MEDKIRVFGYNPEDKRVFEFWMYPNAVHDVVDTFMNDIFFLMTDEEVDLFINGPVEDNLKNDFVWFRPSTSGLQIVECTCGHFLESGQSLDKLAKKAVAHFKRTGHALNPRGN